MGSAADLDDGKPRRGEVNGRALVLVRAGAAVFAVRDVCPHQAARLSDGHVEGTTLACKPGQDVRYGREGEILVCPWHGWEYDLTTGRALVDPDRVRVATYPVRVVDDRVLVTM
ncbi:Rieske 2Fe-2S domain-containing protein [Candidatus Poribacteria bacterium]|nr:Rieske 2Fe-2S domain-containing protein [Candidatus Poribacteria bacterium]